MAERPAEKRHGFQRWVAALKVETRTLNVPSAREPERESEPPSSERPVASLLTLDEQKTLVQKLPREIVHALREREARRRESSQPPGGGRIDEESTAVFVPPPELLQRAKRFNPPPKPGRNALAPPSESEPGSSRSQDSSAGRLGPGSSRTGTSPGRSSNTPVSQSGVHASRPSEVATRMSDSHGRSAISINADSSPPEPVRPSSPRPGGRPSYSDALAAAAARVGAGPANIAQIVTPLAPKPSDSPLPEGPDEVTSRGRLGEEGSSPQVSAALEGETGMADDAPDYDAANPRDSEPATQEYAQGEDRKDRPNPLLWLGWTLAAVLVAAAVALTVYR